MSATHMPPAKYDDALETIAVVLVGLAALIEPATLVVMAAACGAGLTLWILRRIGRER